MSGPGQMAVYMCSYMLLYLGSTWGVSQEYIHYKLIIAMILFRIMDMIFIIGGRLFLMEDGKKIQKKKERNLRNEGLWIDYTEQIGTH